jgi:flagellar motility protein MotE (MotC chaperone)
MSNSKKVKRRRSGRGSILIIALLLVASGVLRLASGADIAVAKVSEAMNQDEAQPHKDDTAQHETKPPMPTPDVGGLLAALQEREAQIKRQEAAIAKRQKALKVADEEISKRLTALAEAEEKLRATLSLADGAAESDLTQLTSVYENMKPKGAAALFEKMEPTFAAGFLGRMRPESAAAIMAGLSPEAAYSISVIFAGRNASVPKN